jgi:Fur family ferric uptake transcriptional regulator
VVETSDLRKAGLKVTLPRMKILEILEGSEKRHQTAEDIYKDLLDAGEEIGLATVYRVLTQFEAAGLVTRHRFEGGQAVFELNRGVHHDHLVCVECGKVVEFVDETIEARQARIAREHGFELADHSMILYGSCQDPKCPNRRG